ncbi:hypothetical protein SJR98_02940 [Aeromonas hydrophila]|uniref:hypothetical protein n=1 Tax=Aeromonas hydrophila TaxID=644 RepID=UPI0029D7769C|nr:hypothetical protein [Aeromonas hydrophila]MDX7777031.1 hypothetical protein [Aeromonas hydrophila]
MTISLDVDINTLDSVGRCLTVTPHQHSIGQQKGGQNTLASPNAIKALAAKLQDGADQLLPAGPLHAVVWLVAGTSEQELATKLAEVCAVLPLPEWCATLRRLTANNDTMAQPTAAMVPRWKADEPLIWEPLRHRLVLTAANDALQESENNSPAPATTRTKLAVLAAKRAARVAELGEALAHKPSLAGMLWSWQGYGEPASLTAQLLDSEHPDHSDSMTVGALLLSPSPLTFWQELTQ